MNIRKIIATFALLIFISACTKNTEKDNLPIVDKVEVCKSKRELYLIKEGKAIRTYRIALGENPVGHKEKEGDERTPEGKYILDWRNSKSAYHKSIHVSYPNAADKVNAKKLGVSAGGDIMIHGMKKSIAWIGSLHSKSDWTNGCIAVTNEEMDEIWAMVKNGTEIEIKK